MNTQIYSALAGARQTAQPSEFKGLVRREGLPRHLRLQEGDGLVVTVVRQEGDSVTLRTEDGIQFTARQSGPPLAVGQSLDLTVTQSTKHSLTVEVTERNTVNLRALLESFGAEPTRENADVARELLRQGAEPTPAMFQRVKEILSSQRTLSPDQAVFMVKHDIPIDNRSVRQFQNFLRHQNQLGGQLEKLLNIFKALEPPVEAQTVPAAPTVPHIISQGAAPPPSLSTENSTLQAPTLGTESANAPGPAGGVPTLPPNTGTEGDAPTQLTGGDIPTQSVEIAKTDPQPTVLAGPTVPSQTGVTPTTSANNSSLIQSGDPSPASAISSESNPPVPTPNGDMPAVLTHNTPNFPSSSTVVTRDVDIVTTGTAVSAGDALPVHTETTADGAHSSAASVTSDNTPTVSNQPTPAASKQSDAVTGGTQAPPVPISSETETPLPVTQFESEGMKSGTPLTEGGLSVPPEDRAVPSASVTKGTSSPENSSSTPSGKPSTVPPSVPENNTGNRPVVDARPIDVTQHTSDNRTADAARLTSNNRPTDSRRPASEPSVPTNAARSSSAEAALWRAAKPWTAHTEQFPRTWTRPAQYFEQSDNSLPQAKPSDTSPPTLRSLAAALFRDAGELAPSTTRKLDSAKLMHDLGKLLEAVESHAADLPHAERAEAGKVAREIEQHVKFLEHINNFTSYIQIPLQIGGKRETAELYVFNDTKGQKRIDPENATLFLSLNTASLGRVESFVKLIGKNVECDFTLEDERTASCFAGAMSDLMEGLKSLGYMLARTSAKIAETPRDVLDVDREHSAMLERYTFNRVI